MSVCPLQTIILREFNGAKCVSPGTERTVRNNFLCGLEPWIQDHISAQITLLPMSNVLNLMSLAQSIIHNAEISIVYIFQMEEVPLLSSQIYLLLDVRFPTSLKGKKTTLGMQGSVLSSCTWVIRDWAFCLLRLMAFFSKGWSILCLPLFTFTFQPTARCFQH